MEGAIITIVCTSEFERPDPKHPEYAIHEVDVYGHLPYTLGQEQHRLSIRKNLRRNTFEAYRHYFDRTLTSSKTKPDEIASTGTLASVIDFTNAEVFKRHRTKNQDQVCDHSTVVSLHCQIVRSEAK